MNRITALILASFLLIAVCASVALAGEIVGDLGSDNNDLSAMISYSGTWNGKNSQINDRLTDTLSKPVHGTCEFKHGTYPAGTYRGWFHGGDSGEFVFYRVVSTTDEGETREIVGAGRCGNPATGTYFVPKPPCPPPPPPQIITKTVEVPVERIVEVTKTITVEKPYPVYLQPPPQQPYIPPAGVSAVWTPEQPIDMGSTTVGEWKDWATLSLFQLPSQPSPKAVAPPGQRPCPPGNPPPPPPPPPVRPPSPEVPIPPCPR